MTLTFQKVASRLNSPIFLVAMLFLATIVASGQLTLDTSFNAGVTDGSSNANVSAQQADGKILVGGNFGFFNGVEKFGLIRLNSDGTLDSSFNPGGTGPSGPVWEIKVLATGKILIGGGFTSYNDTPIQGICRLNADGTLDTTFNAGGTGTPGAVQSITTQSDGKYVLAGTGLNSYNGTTKFSVIRINSDGTLDNGFTSPSNSGGQFVEQTALQSDGKIVIVGVFNFGGYNNVARLNTDGTLDTTFNVGGAGPDGGVFAVKVLPDDKILAGGKFDHYNGVARPSLLRLNSNGSLDTAFAPTAVDFAYVEYIEVSSTGKYLVSGEFQSDAGRFPILSFNTDGTSDASFTPPEADNLGYHIALQTDGKVLLSGFFNNVEVLGGVSHRNFLRLNINGTTDTIFTTSFSANGGVFALLRQSDGKYVVAGNFNSANGVSHPDIARFNSDGSVDNTFQSGYGLFNLNGTASAAALAQQPDGKILMGGAFDTYNLNDAPGLVRLNNDGTQDSSFTPFGINIAVSFVNDILVQPDGKILVAGTGLADGSQSLIRLNSDGSIDQAFTMGGANNAVQRVLRQSDGKLIAFGNFSLYLGGHNRLVRLLADGSIDNTFNIGTGANGPIMSATFQSDGKIMIGGGFTAYNGTTRNHIARLNADGSLDMSFDPGSGTDGNVFSIAVQPDGKIDICGGFATYNGVERSRLARINSNGSVDFSARSGIINSLGNIVRRVMMTADNELLIGGTFLSYSGTPKNSLAKLRLSTPPLFDFDGDGKADISIFRPNAAAEWWYQRSIDSQVTAFQFGSSTDKMVAADFTGDGKTDVAVFRPSTGQWFILRSEDGSFYAFPFGSSGDIPMPADYDGDGKADAAVFRPSSATWFILRSSDGQVSFIPFGANGDQPVAADYDGDGKADIAIFRDNGGNKEWWILRSTAGLFATVFGQTGDRSVQGDYTGDGKADVAFFRPSTGQWFILRSEDFSYFAFPWGTNGDVPTPGDYDGDGKTDAAVFRPSAATWFVSRSTAGQLIIGFGLASDQPVENGFVR